MEEQSATLRRALDALASICRTLPKRNTAIPERDAAPRIPVQTDPSVTQATVASIPPHDPAEWRKPFVQWLDSACVLSSRCFGGVGCLHIAFCEWEAGRGGVPCNRKTFERLLSELGFLIGEVRGVMLVSGLILREDFEGAGL
ncbi:MAG TPA: hypothetical protein VG225_12940 [Terracidiphilus sp.]|jgi:hypothetical protein|nr:hypothetical protein [Terracidiphilus sp.]